MIQKMLQDLGRILRPHLIPIAILLAVSMAFLAPVLSGKVLPQGDVSQWKGSYEETRRYYEETGDRTLWTNSMFGGMPTYQIAPSSPNSMVGSIAVYNVLVSGWSLPKPINALFLYGFSFYLLMLAFRVRPWIALAGALGYAFASFNVIIIEAGHMLQAYALGSAPLVLAAIVYTIRWKKYLLGGALFALAFAINLRTSHIQMTYYVAMLIGIYLLAELVWHAKQKEIKSYLLAGVALGVGAILAVGSNISLQLTTLEYGKESTRSRSELTQKSSNKTGGLDLDYALDHSYEKGEALALLIPNARGGTSQMSALDQKTNKNAAKGMDPQTASIVSAFPAYFGGQSFTSGPAYIGAIFCFLFVLGLFIADKRDRWWLLAGVILSIILAWGKYFLSFNELMIQHFPQYNKFRSVAFTLVIAGLAVPLLGTLALQRILDSGKWTADFLKKKVLPAFILTGGLCLVGVLMPSIIGGDFLSPGQVEETENWKRIGAQEPSFANKDIPAEVLVGLKSARTALVRADALRSFIFISLAALVLWLLGTAKIKQQAAMWAIIGLIAIDLLQVDRRYLKEEDFKLKGNADVQFLPTPADQAILQDKDPHYRVLNANPQQSTFNEARTSYFHKSIGGYHGAKLRRAQEMNETHYYKVIGAIQQMVAQTAQSKLPPAAAIDYLESQNMLGTMNMLNVKYIKIGDQAGDVVLNRHAYGNAWVVKGLLEYPNADSEIVAVGEVNLKDTATYDKRYAKYLAGFTMKPDTNATVKLTEYKPNSLKYDFNAQGEQFVVFSEMYYNSGLGWNAYIDGKPVEHIRVDYSIRGMRVPGGQHKIEFKFEPATYAKGESLSLISSLLLLAGLIGAVVVEVRRARRKENVAVV